MRFIGWRMCDLRGGVLIIGHFVAAWSSLPRRLSSSDVSTGDTWDSSVTTSVNNTKIFHFQTAGPARFPEIPADISVA